MTNETAASTDSGLFDTPFSIVSTAVGAVLLLLGLIIAWTGYQGSELLVVGTELDIVTGAAGFMLAWFFGVVALFAGLYMESGFDH